MTENTLVDKQRQVQQTKDSDLCTWGDIMGKKSDSNVRMAFQNINGFINTNDDHKAEIIREFLNQFEIDIFGMTEMNCNWRLTPKHLNVTELTRGWFEHQHLTYAYNTRDRICRVYQPGGTAILSRGEMSLRTLRSGRDSRGLGRWSWTLFRGKNQLKVRFISVYVPNKTSAAGAKKCTTSSNRHF